MKEPVSAARNPQTRRTSMKNLAASREVSSLERKFIILAGPYPSYSFFNLHVNSYNINRCKQRGMDPAFQSTKAVSNYSR